MADFNGRLQQPLPTETDTRAFRAEVTPDSCTLTSQKNPNLNIRVDEGVTTITNGGQTLAVQDGAVLDVNSQFIAGEDQAKVANATAKVAQATCAGLRKDMTPKLGM